MKNLLTFFTLFISSIGFTQIISINDSAFSESGYGPEELIKEVMISSSCSTTDNFTFKVYGSPSDLTTKSYGYFKRPSGSTFPFEDGVILTTGRAFPAGNTVNESNIRPGYLNGHPFNIDNDGDSDLEAALDISWSQDATYIKFNFTPQGETISFRFLMASDEYDGRYECYFADGFAFLLREEGTSTYTNLAVLPDGITPVSITNINQASLITHDPNDPDPLPDIPCDANIEFFEGYNLDHTNYGGRTVVLTATSTVTPGAQYEIKLVVADQSDSIFDSAIFIEGGSFIIDGDLGPDRLIVNGNPGCQGTDITLDTNLSVARATFEWFKDGVIISGETNSTLLVSTGGTYSFKATSGANCETTDEVVIEFALPEIISPPVDILICETDGNGKEEFDFSVNKTLVLGNQSAVNYPITYHESQAKAESNTDPLPEAYENSSVTETIWLRIANLTQSCYEVISFDIEVRTQPIANTPIDYNLCDDSDDGDDANGISTFNLSSKMSEVLGSQSNLDYTVKFYKNQPLAEAGVDNTEITSPIQNTTNPQSIFARIENKLNVDCFSTTSFQLIVNPLPEIISPPVDILICETDGNGKEEFDFSVNKTLVLGNQSAVNYPITYHESQAKAESNTDPLPEAYENSSVTETIWLRIANLTQSCYEVISFDIEVRTQPIANTPIDYNLCDDSDDGDDANGISTFNLSSKMSEVLGSQSNLDYTVKFYKNQPLAEAGVDNTEITSPIQNTTNPQSIFARIENKLNVDCFSTTSFQLIVNPLPVVKSEVTLKQCDSDTDGITDFNLTEANQLISTDYTNETFSYYLTQVQSEMGLVADQISTPTIYTNPIPVNSVVYARVETTHGCFRTSKVNLAVGATLLDPATFQLEYFVCDDTEVDNDNTNGVAAFDFSDATAKVLAQLPTNQNLTVSYYISEADALAETNSIADITKHRNTENPTTQNIYARVDSNDVNACLGLGHHITLNVDPLPNRNTITDYVLCSDTTQTTFDLTTKDAELIGSQTIPILISYHLSEQHAINNTPIPNPSTYPNTSNPQTIYVRAQFDPDNNMNLDVRECVRTDISFELQVNLNPVLTTPDPIIECNDQVTTLYDLTIRKDQITNNDTSIALTYFETQQDLAANTPIATPTTYTNNTLTKTILVLATGSNQCTKTITLDLTTVLYANINKTPTPIEECEIDNNGFDYFDLTLRETEILNGLNPSEFEISYYEDHTDAISGNTNNIADPTNFENTIVLTQKIYVRVKSKLNPCYFIVPLTIIVNPVPEIDILDRYVICLNKADQVINPVTQSFLPIPPIDTQLSTAIYSFQWYKGSIEEVDFDPTSFIIPGATSSTFSPSSEGTYTVLATNLASGCRIPASTEVVSSYPPESIDVTLLSPVFSDNNRLEVVVVGTGEYEYRVDFGPWQRETLFENVRIGEHIIYVRDLLNCNEIHQREIVIGYPKFFTPNGDGYHDTWNIVGMTMKSSAKIYIFDRYGKLLKQISPTGKGWDGTFNGERLPSSDYWFVLDYNEPVTGKINQLRANFTLKR